MVTVICFTSPELLLQRTAAPLAAFAVWCSIPGGGFGGRRCPRRSLSVTLADKRVPRIMIRHIINLVLLMTFNAFADWPPIVDSKQDIAALPSSTLRVRARGLPDADIPALSHLPLLKHLDFGAGRKALAAPISDKGLASLSSLGLLRLDFLMLGYCTNITDAGLPHIAKMRSITWLSLEVCPNITDAGLASHPTMTNLTGLDLRGCIGITDAGLEHLAAKTNWQTIMLGACPNVTTNAVSKLQRALPKAKIEKEERVEFSQQIMSANFCCTRQTQDTRQRGACEIHFDSDAPDGRRNCRRCNPLVRANKIRLDSRRLAQCRAAKVAAIGARGV